MKVNLLNRRALAQLIAVATCANAALVGNICYASVANNGHDVGTMCFGANQQSLCVETACGTRPTPEQVADCTAKANETIKELQKKKDKQDFIMSLIEGLDNMSNH